jgi:hypothetical protein
MLILLHFCILWDKLRRRYSKSWPTFFLVVNWEFHPVFPFSFGGTKIGLPMMFMGSSLSLQKMVGTGEVQSLSYKVYNSKYKMEMMGPTRRRSLYAKILIHVWTDKTNNNPRVLESCKKVPNGEVRTKWNWCGGNNKNVQPMNEDKVHILLVLTFFSSIEAKI